MPHSNKQELKKYQAEYREKNKEKAKAYAKEYYKLNPPTLEQVRERKLKYKFGISLDHYNEMFSSQGGCCGICGKHQVTMAKRLSVDHCHTTGKVRKLLCANCNVALGLLKENIESLKSMISYLEEFK